MITKGAPPYDPAWAEELTMPLKGGYCGYISAEEGRVRNTPPKRR